MNTHTHAHTPVCMHTHIQAHMYPCMYVYVFPGVGVEPAGEERTRGTEPVLHINGTSRSGIERCRSGPVH